MATDPIASVRFFHFTTSKGKESGASAENSKNIKISFKCKTVEIVREWLDTSVLHYENITLAGMKAGQWSTGVMEPTNQGSFPLLLTTFVVAKDISVTATRFSEELLDSFHKFSSSADAKV